MKVSVLLSASSHEVQDVVDFEHDDVVSREGEKDGLCFIPALFKAPYAVDANVTAMTGLVLDCDGWADDAFDGLVDELRDAGLEFGYYETHSHSNGGRLHRLADGRFGWSRGPGKYLLKQRGADEIVEAVSLEVVTCARVLLPFAEPCPAELWASAWPVLTADVLRQYPTPDQSCKNPSRLYYLPRHPAGESRASEYVQGERLDWRQFGPFSATPPAPQRVDTHDVHPARPEVLAAAEADARKYLETLTEDPSTPGNPVLEKLGAHVINTWDIPLEQALPIGERLNDLLPRPKKSREEWEAPFTNGGRYARGLHGEKRLAFELAHARLPTPTVPTPTVPTPTGHHLEVLRAIIGRVKGPQAERLLAGRRIQGKKDATRAQWLQLIHAITDEMLRAGQLEWPLEMLWQQVEASVRLEAAPQTREWFDEQWNEARLTAVARQAAARVEHESHCLRRAQEILSITTGAPEPVDDPRWLAPFVNAKGNIPDAAATAVARVAFTQSARWRGLQFDTFKREYFLEGTLVDRDRLAAEYHNWCSQRGIPYSREAVRDVFELVDRFDSLTDEWEALPAWDGVERLKTAAVNYLRAEPGRFTSEACRRWLISMAARVYCPGAKVDTALVLHSKQGTGKTTFFSIVGGAGYLSTALNERELTRKLKGYNVVELGEFGYTTHLSVDEIKRWLTDTFDTDRGLYRESVKQLQRRFVIGGSTNKPEMLTDETGNRRFWVIDVGDLNEALLRADRDQLLAEARHEYLAGKRWWFDRTEESDLIAEQERVALEHTESTQMEDIIKETVLSVPPANRPDAVSIAWVFANAQSRPGCYMDRTDKKLEREVSRALRKLFGEVHRSRKHDLQRVWYVPDALLTAPHRPSITTMVPNRANQ